MTLLARAAAALREAGIAHALIGAGALTVHGVNRATHDLDLFVLDPSCLRSDFWSDLESREVSVEIRKGDLTDPLAGVVRLRLPGEVPVDVVVGKFTWQRKILDRAVVRNTQEAAHLPVVRAADLILLKLYAGGAQDGWDIQQLLEGEDRAELIAEVEQLLPELPPRSVKLWRRVLED
jgi:predicted nucleotidyltransferase